MKWGAFRSSNQHDKRYYLRKERIIVYQIAMNVCLAAECTATYSLSKYEDLQTNVELFSRTQIANNPSLSTNGSDHAALHNNDLIAAEVLTIVFCVFVATLFGADYFFLTFWPKRVYPRWYVNTRGFLAVGITAGVFAAALMSTIIVATHSAFITNVTPEAAQSFTNLYFRPPLKYNTWAVNIAYVVVLWLGLIPTAISTFLMFKAAAHDAVHGPMNEKFIEKEKEAPPSQP
ncbi:hypothetical protein K435DRAFT_385520 [Dendrothele bispora CBS 962.96]|uniref:Uncharacterized protein n=1 Tax=Dendrothele bispora (strain CBS 962.96) TaxID=1314807 RepID=A0A4V4HCA7_DENBC|nr:hypothetical protein K435DRAFT_445223 [Dendrothele bispora CBS 962.96]THU85658.1 hypothetical protein K435DRAFT_385520 [Dendrothele bispora CBS 962.96]